MMALRFLFLGLIWTSLSLGVQAQKLQIETQNGQKFIMHTVQPKESLWGIAKLYDVSTDEIVKHNPGVDKVLKHGTKIKIPYTETANSPKTYQSPNQAELEISNAPTTHTVQPKEWLNKIAKDYGVTVEEIKKWNELDSETITPGQELIVGIGKSQAKNKNQPSQTETAKNTDKPGNTTKNQALKSPSPGEMTYHTVAEGEGLYSIAKKYGASVEEVQAWNGLSNTQIKAGDKLKIYKSPATPALVHKVAAKETLFGIAQRYDVKKEQIMEWNQLKEEKVLVGQSLKIYPGPKATLTPTTTTPPLAQTNPGIGSLPNLTGNTPTNPGTGTLPNLTGNTPTNPGTGTLPNLTGNTPTNPGTGALPMDLGSFTGNPDYTSTAPGTYTPTGSQPGAYDPQRGSGNVYTTATSSPLILPITTGMNLYTLQNQYNVRKTELKYWNQDKGWNPADNSPKLIEGQTIRLYVPQRLSHTVQPGETLESIAKLYDVSWRQIEIWNGFPEKQGENLLKTKIGQPLTIYKRTGPKPTQEFENLAKGHSTSQNPDYDPSQPPLTNPQTGYTQPGYPTGTQQPGYTQPGYPTGTQQPGYTQPGYTQPGTQAYVTHTVRQGEFLYDIAQKYGVTIRDIKTWNNLPDYGNPAPNTQLRIYSNPGNPGTTSNYTNPGTFNPSTPDNGLNRGGNPAPTEANPYSNPYGTNYGGYTPPQNPTTNPNYGTNYPTETRPAYTPNATGGYNVQEEGLASLTRFAHSKPYYVLHRTAPVGTTIIITNKANGKSATAEVAARMNPADAPAGVVIEVSAAVMRRLGVNESQKPVVKIEYSMPRR